MSKTDEQERKFGYLLYIGNAPPDFMTRVQKLLLDEDLTGSRSSGLHYTMTEAADLVRLSLDATLIQHLRKLES